MLWPVAAARLILLLFLTQRTPGLRVESKNYYVFFVWGSKVFEPSRPRATARTKGGRVALDENELIHRCQKGDLAAFDDLVRLYEKKVYNLAYRMSGNHDDANDLSQEAFLRVFQSLKDFRGQSSFSTWLYRVVSNVCLDELRQRGRRPTISIDEPVSSDKGETMQRQLADTAPPPDELAERREVREVVQSCIEELSEEYRVVIVLRDLQDLSYQEIAEVLDCSLGTVKSRLNRARLALKERLSQLELFSAAVVYRDGRIVAKGGHGGAL